MKKNNKTSKAKTNTQEPKPGYFTILEGYLHGWAAASKYEPGVILKTSQEIASDLEDMVEIDSFTIASIMSQLGFKAHYEIDGGPHGWMMVKSPGRIHVLLPAAPEAEAPEDD